MLEKAVESLKTGIHVDRHTIYIYKTFKGRFREEQDFEIHVRNNGAETHLLYAKVFHGRPPEYSPWVELYEINERIRLGGRTTSYFDSPFEESILKLFADSLAAGAKMFVEYYNDGETKAQLETGMPVVISRLGHKMFKLGFTWFKDWYYPEGYMEGNQKLQGEKPLNSNVRKRHALSISKELASFSQILARVDTTRIHLKRATARMREISKLLQC